MHALSSSNSLKRLIVFLIPTCMCISFLAGPSFAQIDFDRQIAPLFSSHCLECHSDKEPDGELNLLTKGSAFKGGESGLAISAKSLEKSLLWQRVASDEMPPEHPLPAKEKELLKKWILEGAKWGQDTIDRYAFSTESRAGRDWWSFQPVQNPSPPKIGDENGFDFEKWAANEIDLFVAQKLIEKGLRPTAPASPLALIRRVSFDLVGLPPSPEQIRAFIRDPSAKNYAKFVEELLQSKHYGERWGRHWLDVVRFGESDGFERNFARKNAYPYRNWVIDALNADMPYDQFVQAQLIGDQTLGGVEGLAATGFWVAGVHNTVVGGSKRMRELARQDEIEEVLATVGQTFVGLTINCARCHDHKYDPITQKEYYQLASSISGLGYGEKNAVSKVDADKLKQIDADLQRLRTELATIDNNAKEQIVSARKKGSFKAPEPPKPYARWNFDSDFNDELGKLHGKPVGNARIEKGALILDGKSFVETSPIQSSIREKTLEALVQIDGADQRGGGAISIETRNGVTFDAIVYGEQEPRRWMAGSNNFARTASFKAPEEKDAFQNPVLITIVYQADGTIVGYRDGVQYGSSIRKSGIQSYKANEAEFVFGLRHKPTGGNRNLKGKIFHAAFYDRALKPEEVAAAAGDPSKYVPESQIVEWLSPKDRKKRANIVKKLSESNQLRKETAARSNRRIYTLTAGAGKTTNVLLRGDPANIGDVVKPGAIASITAVDSDFKLPANAPELNRRQELSKWITNRKNPLFARVIVNRVWHYHFGAGINETPNDFGFNGSRPTHPKLLDWLTTKFKGDFGQRLKALHRVIVNSSTYKQAGYANNKDQSRNPREIDSDNRFLWKMNPRRLEAESIRDAMLFVSGKLNRKMGGESFYDVSITSNNGTNYYTPIESNSEDSFRRTIYRFNPRGGRSALLDTFDCPDPASTAPKRAVTTTPLQALSLLNNLFVLKMSDAFAKRVQTEAGENLSRQVDHAWELAIGRKPSAQEKALSKNVAKEHGLSALCRGLFNISEFVVIE